jgi:hypothetical protein
VVLDLLEDNFPERAKSKIILTDNTPLSSSAVIQDRGDRLHVFVADLWFRADPSDLL